MKTLGVSLLAFVSPGLSYSTLQITPKATPESSSGSEQVLVDGGSTRAAIETGLSRARGSGQEQMAGAGAGGRSGSRIKK